jgi:hypothetical protein
MESSPAKQSGNVHEPGPEGGSSPLPFDPEKYRKYLAETGWSEKVQDESLSAVEAAGFLELLKFRIFTEPYEIRPAVQEVASLRRESSNQLLETLEEWNDYLKR